MSMEFDEVCLPTRLSLGSIGGPEYSTTIIVKQDGAEQRIARWRYPIHKYNLAAGIRNKTALAELIHFYVARRGAARGFRYKDWSDFTTATNHVGTVSPYDVTIKPIEGSTTVFQLAKVYDLGDGHYKDRIITKPVSGTVRIGVNGVEAMSGYTVDTTTGRVTFHGSQAGNTITAGFQFDVPVHFMKEMDEVFAVLRQTFTRDNVPDILLEEVRTDGSFVNETAEPPTEPEEPDFEPSEACEHVPYDSGLDADFELEFFAPAIYDDGTVKFVLVNSGDLNDTYSFTSAQLNAGHSFAHPTCQCQVYDSASNTLLFTTAVNVGVAPFSSGPRFSITSDVPGSIGWFGSGDFSHACEWRRNCEVIFNYGPSAIGVEGRVRMLQGVNATVPPEFQNGGDSLSWGGNCNLYFRFPWFDNYRFTVPTLAEGVQIQINTQLKGGYENLTLPTGYGTANATNVETNWVIFFRNDNGSDDYGLPAAVGRKFLWLRLIRESGSPDYLRVQLYTKDWNNVPATEKVLFDTDTNNQLTHYGTRVANVLNYLYFPAVGNVSVWTTDWDHTL